MTKQKLREQVLKKRKGIDKERLTEASDNIHRALIAQSWYMEAKVVHCYASISQRNEVDTRALLKIILDDDKELVMPAMQTNQKTLRHYWVTDLNDLSENSLGILEPGFGREVAPKEIDLVVVPLAACDVSGNRIGYGAGYYDRFLAQANSVNVGLCLREFVFEAVPHEPHDVPLDWVVTEQEVFKCY